MKYCNVVTKNLSIEKEKKVVFTEFFTNLILDSDLCTIYYVDRLLGTMFD